LISLKGDWQSALAKYEKVDVTATKLATYLNALSPEPDWKAILTKLATYLNALSPEPDWKAILTKLVNALGPCGDRLPILVKDALHAAQEVLGGRGKAEAAAAKLAAVSECPLALSPEW
jgi:hypothetical protein